MDKLLALALAGACGAATAQTPATNPMPDGSQDRYLGLGAVSAPRYEGGRDRKVSALPVLQVQWSNGIFISGMSAGVHLSGQPSMEFGPLVGIAARRDESGNARGLGGLAGSGITAALPSTPSSDKVLLTGASRLAGMDEIGYRLQAGGFFNYYLAPSMRVTSNLLYGSGKDRKGLRWTLGVQHLAAQFAPHHALALTAGLTVANRNDNRSYFGVTREQAGRSINPVYDAAGGLRDAHLGLHWNWGLSPSWMLTSELQATRLLGSAKDSPLVERPTNLTASTAIAYRF